MVDQLLSLNSGTCFGSLLFSPVLSLTGSKTQIEGLVWLTAEMMSKESPLEMMPIPEKHLWRLETFTFYAKSDEDWPILMPCHTTLFSLLLIRLTH